MSSSTTGTTGVGEIDLSEYIASVWRARMGILVTGLVFAAVALTVSLSTPRAYQATTTLSVNAPKFGDAGAQPVAASSASFRPFFESRSMAAAVIADLGLGNPPDLLTPSALLSNVISTEEIHGTNLIQLTATFRDPAIAAAIAQRVAQRVVDLAEKVGLGEQTRARDFIKEQVDQAKDRLNRADAQWTSYRDSAQIEALQKDVDATLDERATILPLMVEIESEKAKLAKDEAELATRKRVDVLTKTVDPDAAMQAAARDGTPDGAKVAGLQMRSESVSEVFDKLDSEIATTRANLASLEKEKTQLVDVRKIDAARLPLLVQLYEREATLARLRIERDLAEQVYTDIATKYESSRLEVGGRTTELEIIDPAMRPDVPVSRNVVRNTTLAGLAGLSLAALAAMFLHVLRLSRSREIVSPAK